MAKQYQLIVKDTETGEIVVDETLTSRGPENRFSSGSVGYGAGFKATLESPETGVEARFQASVNFTEVNSKERFLASGGTPKGPKAPKAVEQIEA